MNVVALALLGFTAYFTVGYLGLPWLDTVLPAPLPNLLALAYAFGPVVYFLAFYQGQRTKPAGYVGRFQRPDGEVVHVARLEDGTLMVISEEAAGVTPRDLGTVSGRDLARWHKLASTPDGQDGVARPY